MLQAWHCASKPDSCYHHSKVTPDLREGMITTHTSLNTATAVGQGQISGLTTSPSHQQIPQMGQHKEKTWFGVTATSTDRMQADTESDCRPCQLTKASQGIMQGKNPAVLCKWSSGKHQVRLNLSPRLLIAWDQNKQQAKKVIADGWTEGKRSSVTTVGHPEYTQETPLRQPILVNRGHYTAGKAEDPFSIRPLL